MITKKIIEQLELSLLKAFISQSKDRLNQLIDDGFVEFGSSGKIYKKRDCLSSSAETINFKMFDFGIMELSEEVVLATYKLIQNESVSLRSSIWKRYDDAWRIIFHQGTKIPDSR